MNKEDRRENYDPGRTYYTPTPFSLSHRIYRLLQSSQITLKNENKYHLYKNEQRRKSLKPKISTFEHSCSARAKRTLFSGKSARTLMHFIS